MSRAGEDEFRAIIETDPDIKMAGFIQAASALVDKVDSCDVDGDLNATLLRQIEIYLAAHLYALRDPQFQSKKTADAAATFQGKTGMLLESTYWGQTAMTLDISGCLARFNEQAKNGRKREARLVWLGLPPSDQTDYVDRD